MPFTSWKTIGALTQYRTTKFKQRRQIQTRFGHLQNVQIGGCTGLSFGWVQRYCRYPAETGASRIAILNTDQYWSNIDYLASVFNSNHAGTTYTGRVSTVTQHALGKSVTGHATQISRTDFSTAIAHFDANPGAHVIVMSLGGVNTSHLCAAYQGAANLIFFDPNSGEYTVPNASRAAFLGSLHTQYGTYVSAAGTRIALTINSLLICHLA